MDLVSFVLEYNKLSNQLEKNNRNKLKPVLGAQHYHIFKELA